MRKKMTSENSVSHLIGACTVCGRLIKENEEIIKNNKYICKNCITVVSDETTSDNLNFVPPNGIIKILIYLFSFINPLIGFLCGAIFYSQKSNENKNFGKKCFILMASGIVFYLLIFVLFTIINLAIFGNISDFQFNEGYY